MNFTEDFSPDKIKNKLKIIKIEPDISYLTDNQRKVLSLLIEATKLINELFCIQKFRDYLNIKEEIRKLNNNQITTYFKIQQGPFDQFNDNKPYIANINYSSKAGFYPEDLTLEEWDNYIKDNPEQKGSFISSHTVIIRENKELKAVPYSIYYKNYLKEISDILFEASEYADNFTVKSYIKSQANAFLTNDFYESDIRWLQLAENDIESLISACEFYEDKFLGYKASFTSFIAVKNREEIKKINLIKKLLDIFQQNLPIPEHYKKNKRGSISQIQIVNLLYAGGDARGPIQTAAFNLPNSQKIRQEFGSKKVLIYNIIEAKFNSIMKIIAKQLLSENDYKKVTFQAYFNFILMHEISHELGIGFVKDEKTKLYDVSYFLKDLYNIIEEAKADVMGIFLLTYLVKECYITDCNFIEISTSYLISLLRSMRFGKENAHGLASLIQWNFLSKEEVIINSKDGNLSLDFHKFESVIENMLTYILTLQGEGDYDKTNEFINNYSFINDSLIQYLDNIKDLPIDIYPYYPLAGEDIIEL